MPLVPKKTMWRAGLERYICPVCPYDSVAERDVLHHISTRHQGVEQPPPITTYLSVDPIYLPPGSYPKVSCIMVTKDRRDFVKKALEYFQAQTYPNKELVVVDDGKDSVEDLCAGVPETQCVRVPPQTVGSKRNVACQVATGSLIAHWDDDDWQSPNRLVLQVAELKADKWILGIYRPIFGVLATRKLYIFGGPRSSPTYCSGSTILFRKSLWDRMRFCSVNVGEDTAFVTGCPQTKIQQMDYSGFNVALVHEGNTVTKEVTMAPYVELDCDFPVDA